MSGKQSKARGKNRSRPASVILQLKISVVGIKPAIWRRVFVPGAMRLSDLHQVIQVALGWTDSHLHQFNIGGQCFSPPEESDEESLDEAEVTLSDSVRSEKRFSYTYDFGDDWRHEIVVEKVIGVDIGPVRPHCIAGKRHGPPEDCGGISGYASLLRAVRNPRHREHEETLEWLGGQFDPEEFDIEKVNRALSAVHLRREWVQ